METNWIFRELTFRNLGDDLQPLKTIKLNNYVH